MALLIGERVYSDLKESMHSGRLHDDKMKSSPSIISKDRQNVEYFLLSLHFLAVIVH
jgi:hypothetical protein